MAEVDPVIFDFQARVNGYLADVRRTTQTVDQQLGLQERRVRKLESEMRSSAGGISATMKGLGGALATYFTGRELAGLIDNFTRLQNELRVAGLEGKALAEVQGRLLEIANRNGVAINSLADLYGKSAQAGQELGASQAQLLTLTEATAQALRISGTNAQQASGAILGLSQALASGTVRAEEFNQINEGGLRPLLQAAAASEQFGGSVAKLRAAVLDGRLSSQEFFAAILQGSEQLGTQAAQATLTLSGAYETLQNSLINYVGGSASASGATAAVAEGMALLADNLETVIEALAVIGTALAARYVAGAIAASGATQALAAYLSIATTSLAGTALAARSAGAALLGAFGGPIGIAVGALAAGLIYYASTAENAAAKTDRLAQSAAGAIQRADELEQRARAAGLSVGDTGDAADKTAGKMGGLAQAILGPIRMFEKLAQSATLAELAMVGARQREIETERRGIRGQAITRAGIATGGYVPLKANSPLIAPSNAESDQLASLNAESAALSRQEKALLAAMRSGVDLSAPVPAAAPVVSGTGSPAGRPGGRGATGAGGPSRADVEARVLDEIDAARSRIAAAESRMAGSADEEAELQLRSLENSRRQAMRALETEDRLDQAQRDRLALEIDLVAQAEREVIGFERRRRNEQESRDLAGERYRAEDDALRLQYEQAGTLEERRRISLEALALEDRYREALLRSVLAAESTATEAEKDRARVGLSALQGTAEARRNAVLRANQGPLARYAESLRDPEARAEEAVARRLEDVNEGIESAISKAMGVKDPLVRDLLSILIDDILIRPIIDTLQSAKAKSGGGILGVITSIAGLLGGGGKSVSNAKARATGGPVSAGEPYLVGERGPELIIPSQYGVVIPNQKLNARGGAQGGGTATVRLELSGDIDARIQQVSGGVAVEVVRASQPALTNAAVNETMRRAGRPRL